MLSDRTTAVVRSHIQAAVARGHEDPTSLLAHALADPQVYREIADLDHDTLRTICGRLYRVEAERHRRATVPKSA